MPLIDEIKGKWILENGLTASVEGGIGKLFHGHVMYEGRKFPLIWDEKYNEYSGICPGFNLKNRLPKDDAVPIIRH